MATSISRDKLYAEVWAEAMTTVAKRYDVSSNYLARICEQLNIPRPSRGYWAQRAAGAKVEVPELPEPDPGDDVEWIRGDDPYNRRIAAPKFTGVPQRQTRRAERPKTHPILVSVREDFEDSRIKRYDNDGYLRPKASGLPDIFVSKEALAPALKLANQLFLALEDLGFWVRTAGQNSRFHTGEYEHRDGKIRDHYHGPSKWRGRPTMVYIGGVAVGLALFEIAELVEALREGDAYVRLPANRAGERIKQVEGWRVSHQHLPSARFGLYAYCPYGMITWTKYWRETKRGELDALFPDIAAELERAAASFEGLYNEEARRRDEQHKRWEEERREAARKAREAEREKRLPEQINNWRLARDVRAYVDEIKTLVRTAELQLKEDSEGAKDLQWALDYADRIDPLTSWRKEIDEVKAAFAENLKCPKCGQHHPPDDSDEAHASPDSEASDESGDDTTSAP
ncbi:MAG TPA: hypothetical protein VHB79_30950 [Polyangiaceae bacterium]|nr:hypothetical protein [Polyangiaceae bacterium]